MAAELAREGVLHEPAWRRLFETVPRHVFVPAFYLQSITSGKLTNRLVSRDDPATAEEWEHSVYANRSLLTRPDVSSSATAPRLMAAMLEALGVGEPGPILEIGTGTGYNTALLCAAFDDQVVSIDVDADLIHTARRHLGSIGHKPMLVVGDGAEGHPAGAPYAGLIATCGLHQIPATWVEQVRIGGRIVTPIGTGIAVLTVTSPATAQGRFLPISAYFMPMRPPHPDAGPSAPALAEAQSATGHVRPAELAGETILDDAFQFPLSLTLPDLTHAMTGDPEPAHLFALPDGSWARVRTGTAAQNGPRRIWDEIEDLHADWLRRGRPARDQYTITVEHGQQRIAPDL